MNKGIVIGGVIFALFVLLIGSAASSPAGKESGPTPGSEPATPSAEQEARGQYEGKVTASSGLNVRAAPTMHAALTSGVGAGETVSIDCKVPGPVVDGNARWYRLASGGWVTARYIENIGAAPAWCGDSFDGTVIAAALNVRTGPDLGNTRLGMESRGDGLTIGCKVDGDTIDGNRRWYWVQLRGRDGWVSARYVENAGTIPSRC